MLRTGIDMDLSEDHRRLRDYAREFTREEVTPRVASMEAAGSHVDVAVSGRMEEIGWTGLLIPKEPYGGMGAGHVAKTIVIDELSYESGAAAAIFQASQIPVTALQVLGSEEQKRRWLPQIASGTWTTIAVTEPDQGSDILGMTSTARPGPGGSWIINAHKNFIGNSHIAELHVVVVRTGEPGRDQRALSAFLVENTRPGVSVAEQPFTGMHGFMAGDLRLDNVRVPSSHLLGQVGDGMDVAYGASVACGRLNLAALAYGLHRRVLDETVRFVTRRPRREGHLSDEPVVRRHVADITSGLMNSQLAVYQAAALLDQRVPCDPALFNAKLTAHRAASAASQQACDLFGGYANRADYPIDRLARDIRQTAAPAGPSDHQLHHLGRAVLGPPRTSWSQRFTSPSPSQATTA
ncbi:acyl-CoA dehydrogenase family protein [Streptomyces venezuelae]|uniref:acyl-CoA dehydrogenase family protein n=1 Tax=Streptomyces venezuelae TaxID=54571 RepID=UPI00341FBF3E